MYIMEVQHIIKAFLDDKLRDQLHGRTKIQKMNVIWK